MDLADVIYWIVFFGSLALVMRLYSKWSNSRSQKKNLLTDKEIEAREQETFPWWYQVFMIIYSVVMVGTAVGLVVLSWYMITNYPKLILSGTDYIALSTNPYALYLLLLMFFPGIIIGMLIQGPIIEKFFPSFIRFAEKSQLKSWGIRSRVSSKSITRGWTKITVIALLVILPLLYLAAENYYYVDKQALHYNSFWGFGEKSVSLDGLEKVDAGAWPDNGRNASGINWEYILVFDNGEKFNFKEAGASDLKKLDTYLIERGVPLEVTTLKDGAMAWVNDRGSQDLKDLFAQIFSDSR